MLASIDKNTIMIGLVVLSIAVSLYMFREFKKTQQDVDQCMAFNNDVRAMISAPPPKEVPVAPSSEEPPKEDPQSSGTKKTE